MKTEYDVLKFLNTAEKRKSAVVRKAHISEFVRDEQGRITLPVSADLLLDINCQIVQSSSIIDLIGLGVRTSMTLKVELGDLTVERVRMLHNLSNIFFIDMNVGEEDFFPVTPEQLVLEGFWYEKDGEWLHTQFLLKSPAQERELKRVFINSDPIEALKKIGHDFRVYMKSVNGRIKGDATKIGKRPGLAGTSSIHNPLIKFGRTVEDTDYGYKITGGNVTVAVIKDCVALVNQGLYTVMNGNAELLTYDAAEKPRFRVAGDGQFYYGPNLKELLDLFMNRNISVHQARILACVKGLGVFVPDLSSYMPGVDLLLPESVVKGNIKRVIKHGHALEYRVANYAKPKSWESDMCYQFVQAMNLGANSLKQLASEKFDAMLEALDDQDALLKLVGTKEVDEFTEEELKAEGLETSLRQFLSVSPDAAKDLWAQRKAGDILRKWFERYLGGSVPVDAQFRYAVNDPYAILSTYRDRHIVETDADGRYIILGSYGLSAGHAVMIGNKEHDYTMRSGKTVAFGRVPCIAPSEMRTVMLTAPTAYASTPRGAFENIVILSVHDFNMEAAGGGDFDGDKVQLFLSPIIVKAVQDFMHLPVILDDGCPWSNPNIDLSIFEIDVLESEYSRETEEMIYDLLKRYDVLTLQRNKIGYYTNIATKIADGIRSLAMKAKLTHGDARDAILHEMKNLSKHLTYLRYVVGFEIDRPKNGGYFEQEMAHVLGFIKDPPASISGTTKSGLKYYKTPNWMSAHNGRKGGVNTGSVLCQYHAMLKDYMVMLEQKLAAKSEALFAATETQEGKYRNSIAAELTAGIHIDADVYEALAEEIAPIKRSYNEGVGLLVKERNKLLAKMSDASDVIHIRFQEAMKAHSEKHRDHLAKLEEYYSAEHIGYVAYMLTYSDLRKTKRHHHDGSEEVFYSSINFPWTVAKHQMLAACHAAKHPVAISNVPALTKLTFKTKYNLEKLHDALVNVPEVSVVLDKGAYRIFTRGHDIGTLVLSDCYKVSGSVRIDVNVKHIELFGKHTITITV
jgi:hypothetical protein